MNLISSSLLAISNYFFGPSPFDKKNFFTKLFLIYIFLKIFLVILLITILPSLFGQSYFNYSDFSSYTVHPIIFFDFHSTRVIEGNEFFDIFINLMNIQSISDYRAIGISVIVTTLRDLILISILLKKRILGPASLLFFVVVLALHPYLGLYHAKLSTTIFASLGVALMYYVLINARPQSWFIDLSFIVLSGFRNTFAGIVIPYYIWEIIRQLIGIIKGGKYFDYYFLKNVVSLVALLFVVLLSGQYMFNFITVRTVYSLDINFFSQYLNTSIAVLDIFVAFVLVIFSHLIFLLGFREEAYTNFPEFFIPFDSMIFLNIFIGIIFFTLHGVGFFSFMKSYLSRDKRYLIFIFILIPTLISVAHLRYFMPFIPLSLIGFSMLIDKKINSTY